MTERTLSMLPPQHLLLALRRSAPAPLPVRTLTPGDLSQAAGQPVLDRLPVDWSPLWTPDSEFQPTAAQMDAWHVRCEVLPLEHATEYDAAALWCAKRGYKGNYASPLPPNMASDGALRYIQADPEAFQQRVREMAYGLAMDTMAPVPMDRWQETTSYPEVKGAK